MTATFLKTKQRFFSISEKGPPRATCSTSLIYLCLAGPGLNQDVCQGSWGKMTLQGYEKFITIKYQVMNNKCIHYFVHYMTASFKMLHVVFFFILRAHYKSINRYSITHPGTFRRLVTTLKKGVFLTYYTIVDVNILNTICSFITKHKMCQVNLSQISKFQMDKQDTCIFGSIISTWRYATPISF